MKRLLVFFLSVTVYVAEASEVVIAGDNWCPVNCGKEELQQGYMIDVARLALKESGYPVRYEEMPWARAVAKARAGEIHAVVGAFHGDAPDFVFPLYPLLNMSSNSLFTRVESDWRFTGLGSLEGVRLGVVKGYDYGELLNTYIASYNLDPARVSVLAGDNPVERNIKQLLRGRIDAFVESSPVFWYTAKNLKVARLLRNAGQVGAGEECYVAFSPKRDDTQAIVAAFERGVLALSRQGKLKTLAEAYGLPGSLVPEEF